MFINLTPHSIRIRSLTGAPDVVIEPHAPHAPARVERPELEVEFIDGVPVRRRAPGVLVNLLPQKPGVFYIVSAVVGAETRDREDILCPGTGPGDEPIRYKDGPRKGEIEAVTCLVRP